MDPKEIIREFYTRFQEKDHEAMASCYHDRLAFYDPVFQSLNYKEAAAMWHMLCERGKDLKITFSGVESSNNEGICTWEAYYTFSATNRKVHNIIQSKFEFADGKIVKHTDHFNFWKWSRQSLGLPGILLGWAPFLKNKVRKQAKGNLAKFIESNSSKYQ